MTLPFQPVEIWAGAGFSCAMPAEGGPQCWGINLKGQLGRGFGTDDVGPRPEPEPLSGSVSLDRLSVAPVNNNSMHACALSPAGVALCWGGNAYGQLGRTTSWTCNWLYPLLCDGRPSPVDAPFTFEWIAAGGYHTCGVTVDGEVYCWGDNRKGQLGAPRRSGSGPGPASRLSPAVPRSGGSARPPPRSPF